MLCHDIGPYLHITGPICGRHVLKKELKGRKGEGEKKKTEKKAELGIRLSWKELHGSMYLAERRSRFTHVGGRSEQNK